MAFSPDGSTLASVGEIYVNNNVADIGVRLWNVSDGNFIKSFNNDHYYYGDRTLENSVAFSPDGSMIASGDDNGNIDLWSVNDGSRLKTFKIYINVNIAFSPDNRLLAAGGLGEIKLWEIKDSKLLKTFASAPDEYNSVAISHNGKIFANGGNEISLWAVNNLELKPIMIGFNENIKSIAFSPDDNLIASSGNDNIKIWKLAIGHK